MGGIAYDSTEVYKQLSTASVKSARALEELSTALEGQDDSAEPSFSPPYFYVGLAEHEASEEHQRQLAEEAERVRLEVIESEYEQLLRFNEIALNRPLTGTEKRILKQFGTLEELLGS